MYNYSKNIDISRIEKNYISMRYERYLYILFIRITDT